MAANNHQSDLNPRVNPSLFSWKYEIYQVLTGTRASNLLNFGSTASEYVESLILSSDDKVLSRLFFSEALVEVVDEISLSALSDYAQNCLLSLIIEFSPRNGFGKIADYLRQGGTFNDAFTTYGDPTPTDLHLKALYILRNYVYVAPSDVETSATFKTYVGLLNQHVALSAYCEFAVLELVRLGKLTAGTSEIRSFIQDRSDLIAPLVHFFGSSEHRLYTRDDLRNFVADTIEVSATAQKACFDALVSLGELNYADDLPTGFEFADDNVPRFIQFEDGDIYEFGFGEKEIKLFVQHNLELERKDDKLQLVSLLKNADKGDRKISEGLTALFVESVALGNTAIDEFVQDLSSHDAYICVEEDSIAIYQRRTKFIFPLIEEPDNLKYFQDFRTWEIRKAQSAERIEALVANASARF